MGAKRRRRKLEGSQRAALGAGQGTAITRQGTPLRTWVMVRSQAWRLRLAPIRPKTPTQDRAPGNDLGLEIKLPD